jgi:hypothetical protein
MSTREERMTPSEAWDAAVEACKHEGMGRSRANFNHVPECSRVMDWIQQDIDALKGRCPDALGLRPPVLDK